MQKWRSGDCNGGPAWQRQTASGHQLFRAELERMHEVDCIAGGDGVALSPQPGDNADEPSAA